MGNYQGIRIPKPLIDEANLQGREINKTRPFVVISPNDLSALATVLVGPMATKGF
ncbi:MAG: hypothetical protein HOE45_10930 [Gammaproteobacteria bacterium]|nr:hypothetical protein [Gammaproteobacteria bacterium]MBT4147362.1 hypothetical protein [Gammaproteobacteria bacterium]MBT5221745.1 hypothetical protein [Gammaproteobacteria bacterium]MBT5826447.1 hypothetical protein [Gammaproteobacteria bacterium]MBT5967010.1 hypothetical protein [Gammaproteobacteria bacterium]